MSVQIANEQIKRQQLSVRVLRKDGTIEEYGVVSANHRNPVINCWLIAKVIIQQWWVRRKLRRS